MASMVESLAIWVCLFNNMISIRISQFHPRILPILESFWLGFADESQIPEMVRTFDQISFSLKKLWWNLMIFDR
ncbi:unnamed protein product [Arabidopsis halleri]